MQLRRTENESGPLVQTGPFPRALCPLKNNWLRMFMIILYVQKKKEHRWNEAVHTYSAGIYPVISDTKHRHSMDSCETFTFLPRGTFAIRNKMWAMLVPVSRIVMENILYKIKLQGKYKTNWERGFEGTMNSCTLAPQKLRGARIKMTDISASTGIHIEHSLKVFL